MTNFPSQLDTDVELPAVYNNITEIGSDAINALRAAVFAVELEIGTGTSGLQASGTAGSIAQRLAVSINPDGTLKSQPPLSLIYDGYVAPSAGIQESKLSLTYSTAFLKGLIDTLNNSVTVFNNFLSTTGIKVEPHINGTNYRHLLSHIDVNPSPLFFKTAPVANFKQTGSAVISRNTFNADTLLNDINTDLVIHEKADSTAGVTQLSGGTVPPLNYAHMAGGVFIDTSHFAVIPSTINDGQKFAEFVDDSSLLLIGTRTQTLFSDGIPHSSRSSSLLSDNGGQLLVSTTPAITYLLFSAANQPVDDISHGDDVILFQPSSTVLANDTFDAQFSLVSPGDIVVIDYNNGTIPVSFRIDSKKSILNGSNRTYALRISGKNLYASPNANVTVYKSFYNEDKYGVLALGTAHNQFNAQDTLITAHPRSAAALGLGFNPDKIDSTHYNLYLTFYPDGNPLNKTIQLPPIDITGNQGQTPGKYTLDSLKISINNAFRTNGYNYRFIAYSYKGEIGIMLADPYNNASFSIISGVLNSTGNYDANSLNNYPFNIVDNFNNIDPLGLGVTGSNAASPPYTSSYTNPIVALAPTFIFAPMKRNFFYVDGVERERLDLEVSTLLDTYGDGYWPATITVRNVLGNRVETTYQINFDLSTSGLKVGKTIVVQPTMAVNSGSYNQNDYGRFIIDDVVFNNCPGPTAVTLITVYDSVFGTGISPAATSVNIPVLLYFNDDSVGFDGENVSDSSVSATFKRHFEILANTNGNIYSHERARFNLSGADLTIDIPNSVILYSTAELAHINIINVSPKLRGYNFLVYTKINLFITSYDATTGTFSGYLSKFDGLNRNHLGPTVSGKKGEVVRFYDESNVDYIDFLFDFTESVSTFTNKGIDIQLFPSLQLNQEKFFIGTCQTNDSSKSVDHLKDRRQFGNISERHLSDSALDYISASDKLIRENGLIRGFDIVSGTPTNVISLSGGTALVNGKIVNINETTTVLPVLQEVLSPGFTTTVNTINWFVCLNETGQIELIANTDFNPVTLSATYGSLDHNRLFYVQNPNLLSPTPYNIRASWLFNIVTKFRNVLPLYMINTTITQVSGTYQVTLAVAQDIRRYTADGNSGLNSPLVLAPNGNFRSIDALNYYLIQLNNNISYSNNYFGNKVIVRGYWTLTTVETFDFYNKVEIIGEGATFNITNQYGFRLKSNITLKNINFINSYDATSNPAFNSSNLINSAGGVLIATAVSTTSPQTNGLQNITIEGCTFTSNITNRFAFISFNFPTNGSTAQNIFIKNNKFIVTSAFGGPADDLSAVIAFTGPSSSPPSTSSATLTNCVIDGNICQKNNMIAITALFNAGTNTIVDAIVPVNVSITNNICGSINFLMRRGNISTLANTGFILDKENSIFIAGNNCRLIYTGISTGSLNTPTSVIAGVAFNNGLFSCNATIKNNTASWIQVGITVPKLPTDRHPYPELIINNNKLLANAPSILNSYVLNTPFVGVNAALLINRVNNAV